MSLSFTIASLAFSLVTLHRGIIIWWLCGLFWNRIRDHSLRTPVNPNCCGRSLYLRVSFGLSAVRLDAHYLFALRRKEWKRKSSRNIQQRESVHGNLGRVMNPMDVSSKGLWVSVSLYYLDFLAHHWPADSIISNIIILINVIVQVRVHSWIALST